MPDSLLASGQAVYWIGAVLLIIARVGFIIYFMPGIGEQAVPMRVRAMIILIFATSLAVTGVVELPVLSGLGEFFHYLALEATIGLFFGLLLRLAVWMLAITGTIIAQVIGLSQMLGIALETEAQTITANMMSMAGAALLLSMDYHLSVFVRVVSLYVDIPAGEIGLIDPMFLVMNGFQAFSLAIMLAWPFVAVNLLYNICLGFINKALPSLMVAFVGAPFMIGAGIMLLAFSIMTMLVVWGDRVPSIIGWL
ncbi:flagellar biosynthetic protein FliR [Henriciella marina]|uniref:flagellar biosynthetic protein FliR n=1 Tax=Henriciella marina TaxID=453851 RepID=UPI00036A8B48|nr:flagellar biosynthetic protein FliR [Henriciella marina]